MAGLDKETVRSRLIVVPQDPFTLHTTLRENMNIRSEHTDEELTAVLVKAGLWPTFQGRQGLDTLLTPNVLSHGQRQILAFATTTLQRGSILLLDEPSSQ